MSDTFASKRYNQVYVSGNRHTETATAGQAGIWPGYAIRIHTDGKAYLAKAGEDFAGIAREPRGGGLDEVIADAAEFDYYPAGNAVTVIVHLLSQSPIIAVAIGNKMALSATDGHVMKFVYVDSTEATDSPTADIGRCKSTDAGHLSNDHLIEMSMGG